MATRSELKLNDVVVSKVEDGHHLLIVTAIPDDQVSLIYRGDGWNVQYAVARGARLAEGKAGDLWYTSDELANLRVPGNILIRSRSHIRPLAHLPAQIYG